MINFEKWHGNGNDFVLINSIENPLKITKTFIQKISNRNQGIGFDQLIYIGLPTKGEYDFYVKFFNCDGSEAGMCLNGIRCAASYIWKNKFFPNSQINLQTKFKSILCSPEDNNDVSVIIDKPNKLNNKVISDKIQKKIGPDFFLSNIGNNHILIDMGSIKKIDLNDLYDNLKNIIKKESMNLSIFEITKSNLFLIRTYENGVGETLSCGSAALCLANNFLVGKRKLKVKSHGGTLEFKNKDKYILMQGPSKFIYQGNIVE